ncbi:anion transporter [Beggiatoa alba B18LD]|uniref:Anion transporter n=1 Tax=Beggiatoa alba B18LD TaxID=395493 RepID=I3CEW8_9GAMM|nr:DASS family sodium-coupled anion symporter [Beggiatoa alba]EIJ42161.1 anion transporter [Beggiatoa alba B18LD]
MRKLLGVFLALGLAILAYIVAIQFFTEEQARLFAVLTLLLTLWTNEALPLGVVSLFPIILFPMLGILDTNQTSANYSNSIIFLFIGGFLLAIATEKTELHKIIAYKVVKSFPATPRGLLASLTMTTALLSMILSNTTATLLLLPIAVFVTQNRLLQSRLALAIAFGSSIGGIATPIGTPPNLILLGFLESNHLPMISFVQWMVLTLPLVIFMLLGMIAILSIGLKKEENLTIEWAQQQRLTIAQWRLLGVLVATVALLLLNSPIQPYYNGLGLNEKGILLSAGLLTFLPVLGVLTWEDTKKLPFEVVFLFGAGFAIAEAFHQTGFSNQIAQFLTHIIAFPHSLIILSMALLTVFFTTTITSNTALSAMMLPLIYTFTTKTGLNSDLFLLITTVCASFAFILPISTPPNAIAFAGGYVTVKQMLGFGSLLTLLGVLIVFLVAEFYWGWMFAFLAD